MKDRLSPIGSLSIRTLKGLQVTLENLTDQGAPVSEEPKIDERGKVTLPSGSTARIRIQHGDSETNLVAYHYRERTGHTPGARIIGDGVNEIFDPKTSKKFIPGIGYTEYRE